MARSNCLIFKN